MTKRQEEGSRRLLSNNKVTPGALYTQGLRRARWMEIVKLYAMAEYHQNSQKQKQKKL